MDFLAELDAWRARHNVKQVRLAEILQLTHASEIANWRGRGRGRIPSDHMPAVIAVINSNSESAAVLAAKRARKSGFSDLAALVAESKAPQAKSPQDLEEQLLDAAIAATPEAVCEALIPLLDSMTLPKRLKFLRKVLDLPTGE